MLTPNWIENCFILKVNKFEVYRFNKILTMMSHFHYVYFPKNKREHNEDLSCLGLYTISTLVGYSMPNPVIYIYIYIYSVYGGF